jgi:hypothetical protein
MPHEHDTPHTMPARAPAGALAARRWPAAGWTSASIAPCASDDEQERTSTLLLRDEWSSLQAPAYLPLPVWTKPSSQRDDF